MKYEIDKIGEPGHIHLENEDILAVKPSKSHAAELTVRYRNQYQEQGAFEWQARTKDLRLPLNTRQALVIVNAEREAQDAFCSPCYDWGKQETAPDDCLRCQLLLACMKSGAGDFRRGRPEVAAGPTWVREAAFVVLLLVWAWTLNQWASASAERDAALSQLRGQKIVVKGMER